MVNTPSPAAQSSDVEQKKRKQTLERAKANHVRSLPASHMCFGDLSGHTIYLFLWFGFHSCRGNSKCGFNMPNSKSIMVGYVSSHITP